MAEKHLPKGAIDDPSRISPEDAIE
ncbi:hypothetical protein CCACVL1_28049 [Corchorus capsularis]|uniref:Uncharacterized protein n=1 Tax=Corchorus capsularis TaxID=210143 RepID=A0A1R3G7P6_COCAP|nr:hypothetical protein CCACVL1_28049 [Corchorus capsularis]